MKNYLNSFKLIFVSVILSSSVAISQNIVINEILTSNEAGIRDMDGDASDWIELYNPSDDIVSLLGYEITDDFDGSETWIFPDTVIFPGGFLFLWASGKDRSAGEELHTDFKLDKDGEFLALYDSDGNTCDSLHFGEQRQDISYGRTPDGGNQFVFFNEPSPGAPNQSGIEFIETPTFSHDQGYYDAPITVTLSTENPDFEIYYTTNGDIPTTESFRYNSPINIDTTTAIRALSYDSRGISSAVITHTYLINENIQLPVLSVVTDNANLYDEDIGIWVNDDKSGDEWERPVSVSYFKKNDGQQFSLNAGIRIHGDATRGGLKKSFRLYFRSEYGQSELNYQIFPSKNIDKFKRLVLRMGGQDHNLGSAYWTMLRCPLLQRLFSEVQPTMSTSRPFILFLNGELFGLYHFRERIDKYYLEENFGITDADLIKSLWVWSGEIIEGDREHWEQTYMFFKMNDLSVPENMAIAEQLIDIGNFTDYYIFNMFGANWDWPQNNVYKFRDRETNGKWRWVMWDVDAIFARSTAEAPYPNWNALEWVTREEVRTDLNSSDTPNLVWSTTLFRSLLRNGDYRHYFINRFADMLNTTLHYHHIHQVLDSLTAVVEPDYHLEAERWGVTQERWLENIDRIKNYVIERRVFMLRHIRDYFGIGNVANIIINPQPLDLGFVKVNTIVPDNYPWTGTYFKGLPFPVLAKPLAGNLFVRWDGDIPETSDSLMITLNSNLMISPIFEVNTSYDNIVINEINYNSSSEYDTEDWIELYNHSDHEVDLTGWIFMDSEASHTFELPAQTTLLPGDYLVLVRESEAFCSFFPEVDNYIGNFDFGLNGSSDVVRIRNSSGTTIDSLCYDDDDPWPPEADGDGPTLELINPDLDNTLPQSWEASTKYGTPGLPNDANPDPVPVSLAYFQIKSASFDKIILEWRTESEMNSLGFDIEKMNSNGDFQRIGFLKSHGTSAQPHTYQFIDDDILSEHCTYRLKQVDYDGSFHYSAEISASIEMPATLVVNPCYPNPFNNSTMISFYNPVESRATISIFNIRGELIATLFDQQLPMGRHQFRWHSTDANQKVISSGIYFVKIQVSNEIQIVKGICIK